MNQVLVEQAQHGDDEHANKELWQQSLTLVEAFMNLALRQPEKFRPHARESLLMPSVRSRNPEFTADAERISKAVQLSSNCLTQNLTEARGRLGSLAGALVADSVEEVHYARRVWKMNFEPYGEPVRWPEQDDVNPFLGKSSHQIIADLQVTIKSGRKFINDDWQVKLRAFCRNPTRAGSGRLHFLLLPELTSQTASIWWKEALEKMIEAKFDSLRGFPIWDELGAATDNGTDRARLWTLKKYCVGKVGHSAGPPPTSPHPENRP